MAGPSLAGTAKSFTSRKLERKRLDVSAAMKTDRSTLLLRPSNIPVDLVDIRLSLLFIDNF